MSYRQFVPSIIIAALIMTLSACGDQTNTAEPALAVSETPAQINTLTQIIASQKPTDAISITTAKAQLKAGQPITIKGRIGGRVDPFISGRAAMIIADSEAITACDAMDDDHCTTPWDFCCEDKNAVAQATALVQVVDNNGQVVKNDLKGLGGLQPGSYVVVEGTIDQQPASDNLVINAKHIFLDAKNHGVETKP